MKLEVGKYYKTRNGKKIYCALDRQTICTKLVSSDYPFLCISMDGTTTAYTSSGIWTLNNPSSPEDIIAEWVEPHPLEGCAKGTLIWVSDRDPACYVDVRIEYFDSLSPDNKTIYTAPLNGLRTQRSWNYGKRITSSQI